MKLISWNVNGIRSIYKKGFLDHVGTWDADIICLQEHKAQHEKLSDTILNIPGYRAYFSSALRPGYSGVTTYIRDFISVSSVQYGIGDSRFDDEGRFLILKIESPRPVLLYNIYFPSGTTGEVRQQYKYDFLDTVTSHLNSLPAEDRAKLIVTGDFNICHTELDIHHPETATKRQLSGFLPDERAWMDSLIEYGFVDSFRHHNGPVKDIYSWWTYRAGAREKNKGWRIDYFFVHKELARYISTADIYTEVRGSDHCPIALTFGGGEENG